MAARMSPYKLRKRAFVVFTHASLIVLSFVIAFPILFALIKSTQTPAQVFSYPPKFSIGPGAAENYSVAWREYNLGRLMLNTTVVAFAVTIGKTLLSLLAALALVYFDFPFKGLIFVFILVTLMMPIPVRIVPLFDLVRKLGWGNSFWALTIPFLASATGTFLFRQHFMSIPASLVDAARVDGVGPMRFLWQILVPMSMNTVGALAVIEFVYIWNQYLWPLIIISSNKNQMIQIGLKMLTGAGPQGMVNWGVAMAGTVITMLPPLIIFILLQEQFMRGFALAEEK
ncbi:MAG: Carbohydrate ABC transporter membrane protein 2, CUT1 family [Acetothermia bacterium 64_32]|nr:MAG: Carbohydrate ABC transporter membrane protein 2, CUT1 family [Acetothermia bacterium 64_32]MBC7098915.1 carbohydrate ABC transporter permease [Candidatus Bipolaricaulota bacterium]HAF71061.1 glycerol-3-phosphate ABC transporter permease [Candidatus Acetothermia bacterium]